MDRLGKKTLPHYPLPARNPSHSAESKMAHDVGIVRNTMPNSRNSRSTGKQADALLARLMRAEKDGSLAQCVRAVVATNRRKAAKSNPAV
jgi:hypothetical protein